MCRTAATFSGAWSFRMRQRSSGDTFYEVGGPQQQCTFTDKELYLKDGPGRIPQHHAVVLEYYRLLKVRLEPYIFLCEANRLQNDAVFDGTPVSFRRVRYALHSHIAELLPK